MTRDVRDSSTRGRPQTLTVVPLQPGPRAALLLPAGRRTGDQGLGPRPAGHVRR
jgi:hypothetical protein